MNRMLIKMKLSTGVTLPDAFPSNLLTVVYWKMKFPSFDWLKVAYYSFCTMRALIYARAAQGTQEHHACAKSREPAEEIPRAQK